MLAVAIAVVLAGFETGFFYAHAHRARSPETAEPPAATAAFFASLDVCDGTAPVHASFEPDTSVGRHVSYRYHYRCADGSTGTAYEDAPVASVAAHGESEGADGQEPTAP